ncbi:hypothetical protein PAXRUDRAFT_14493 [Paxillus rubicundulus Ve08.2h10]|uniref:Transmembrane protein n=1 Tax=Paxillus rubicundulus Ve08.2h10 TaxID=930991 RepID=A0A0D0DK34_9AGAM|nr:hypothetical protein PAXRUDRAFT_14493 [Paxillus rubicundulus Ve08.2h10]
MRRPPDVALRAGLYIAATISGVAAAYVVTEFILNLRDSWNPGLSLPHSHDDNDGDGEANQDTKAGSNTLDLSARCDIGSPVTSFSHGFVGSRPSDHTVDVPASASEYALPIYDEDTRPSPFVGTSAATSLTSTLPQLCIPSPPLASSLADGPAPSTQNRSPSDSISPTSSEATFSPPLSCPVLGSEDDDTLDNDDPQRASPVTQEAGIASFASVLSPSTRRISIRRSVRAHDLFSASHLSFAELGSLMAGERRG